MSRKPAETSLGWLPWSCRWKQYTVDCDSCYYMRERHQVFFSFIYFILSFFKPDNFLQLTWDLILTSWSFTCFDILEIKMSVRLSPSRVWSDITETLLKLIILPVCFLLKGYLKDKFSFDTINLGTGWGRNQKVCIFIQLCHLLLLCSEGTICHLCLSLPVCKKIINVPF